MKTTLGTKVHALNTIKNAVEQLQLEGELVDTERVKLMVLWITFCWKTE